MINRHGLQSVNDVTVKGILILNGEIMRVYDPVLRTTDAPDTKTMAIFELRKPAQSRMYKCFVCVPLSAMSYNETHSRHGHVIAHIHTKSPYHGYEQFT